MSITHTNDSLDVTYHAQRNPGWHLAGHNNRTQRAIKRAKELGAIETRRLPGGHNLQIQYRAIQPRIGYAGETTTFDCGE